MLARKDKVVKDLTDGVRHLFRKNHIEVFSGIGSLEFAADHRRSP